MISRNLQRVSKSIKPSSAFKKQTSLQPHIFHQRNISSTPANASQAHNNVTPARRGERSLFRDDFFNGPRCDLHQNEKEFILEAEIPGIPKDQIKLEVDEKSRKITIAGEVKSTYTNQSSSQEQEKNTQQQTKEVTKTDSNKEITQAQPRTLISERSYGRIERSWVLPSTADFSKVSAKISDGILKVTVPFIQEQKVKPRAVTIEDANE